jgi:ASC-1-like (ASCH) protein
MSARRGQQKELINVDISNMNFSNIKRISNEDDIDNIVCNEEEHSSPIYNIDESQNIVVIGDIHGDLTSLLVILYASRLINDNLEWAGGNSFLIFTGDLLDDYRDSSSIDFMKQHPADEITIISYLADLNAQSLKLGGRVLLCIGNHELINIIENRFVYVSEPTKKYFSDNLSSREEQFRPNSKLRQKLSCLFEPFILINSKYFVCHAGVTPKFIEDLNLHYKLPVMDNLAQFSRDMKNIIMVGCNTDNEWIMEHIMPGHPDAFFWTRHYRTKDQSCSIFENVSKLLGLTDLILIKGHDTQDNIVQSCNKKIYIIDTTISRAFLPKNKKNSEKFISDYMNYLQINNDLFSIFTVKLLHPEQIYKQKLEQFIFQHTLHIQEPTDLSSLNINQLRQLAKTKGIPTSGTKQEIIFRISQTQETTPIPHQHQSNSFHGKLQTPYYEFIKQGIKIYEMRVNDDKRQKMNIGDIWKFNHATDQTLPEFNTTIIDKKIYKSFEEAINQTGYENLLPNAQSKEEAIQIYNSFDNGNYQLDAQKYGVVCFKLQLSP